MASIGLQNIRKSYGSLPVIHGVDVAIEDGEFIILVGPSGCGKSTLLRMIAGLESISDGRLSIGGAVVNGLRSKDRDIAMVFQNYALYPHLTVAKNMGFSLKLRGVAKDEIARRVDNAAKVLALESYLYRHPRHLSGGQRQRVAMGRAIVRDPKVFLFDEPLSNLDAKLRVAMRAEIKELHQRLKITTVYVTHDQTEAMTMADRIVVMRDGIVEQVGTPLDIYDNPATTFVAGFIGMPAMNLIKGRVQADDPRTFRTTDGIPLPLPAERTPLCGDRELIYGVRPEKLSVVAQGCIPAGVAVVEPTGSETQVIVRVEEQDLTVLLRERVALRPGETIFLDVNATDIHLFDAATGRRLQATQNTATRIVDRVGAGS